jgi:hypothetical protein
MYPTTILMSFYNLWITFHKARQKKGSDKAIIMGSRTQDVIANKKGVPLPQFSVAEEGILYVVNHEKTTGINGI